VADPMRMKGLLVCAAAFAVGAVVAFMSAGPALFADGAVSERLYVLGISVVVYFALGWAVGALAPSMWKSAAACLVVPLVPVVVLFSEGFSERAVALLAIGFLLGDTAGAMFGSWLGARYRSGKAPATS